jgi:hypothetical protein
VVERRRHLLGCHESGDVGHVAHQVGTYLIADLQMAHIRAPHSAHNDGWGAKSEREEGFSANLTHASVVKVARVGGGAGDDDLGPEEEGRPAQLIVVNVAGRLVQPADIDNDSSSNNKKDEALT